MASRDARRRSPLRVVLVGTGTEVGKTHVACALLVAWGERTRVAGLKPVETGVALADSALATGRARRGHGSRRGAASGGRPAGDVHQRGSTTRGSEVTDQARLARAAGVFHVKQTSKAGSRRSNAAPHLPREALFVFAEPISPHLAARQEGVRLDAGVIERWVRAHEAPVTIIETAGGLFSPLGQGATNFDLLRALRPHAVILVAADRLGVLHELTATLGLAGARGGPELGVVLSTPAVRDASTGRNAAEIAALGIARPIAVFPRAAERAPSTLEAARTVITWIEEAQRRDGTTRRASRPESPTAGAPLIGRSPLVPPRVPRPPPEARSEVGPSPNRGGERRHALRASRRA